VRQEKTAIEIFDLSQNLAGRGASLIFGLGEPFEEEEREEVAVEKISPPLLGCFELVLQIVLVVVVDESFLCRK